MPTGQVGSFFQNSFYVGGTFNAILYGVELVLYFQTMNRLRKSRHGSNRFFMFFSSAQLLCITVFVATRSIIAQEMWVVRQDWPEESTAYFLQYSPTWYETLGSTAFILLQLMSDALLIHRCWTLWCGNWRVILFPCVLWLVTLVSGILELFASGSPNTNSFAGVAAHAGLAYFALTIGHNVITTGIICGRIISYAQIMGKELGQEFASTYFTISSIIIESTLPYTLFGVAFLVAFGMESEFSVLLLSLYGMFTCISPQMLILRVAEGMAWTRDTGSQHLATVEFAFSDITGQTAVQLPVHAPQPSESSSCQSEKSVKTDVMSG